jgi:hypothetical protein
MSRRCTSPFLIGGLRGLFSQNTQRVRLRSVGTSQRANQIQLGAALVKVSDASQYTIDLSVSAKRINISEMEHQSAPNTRMATVDHKITPDPRSIVAAHSVEAR